MLDERFRPPLHVCGRFSGPPQGRVAAERRLWMQALAQMGMNHAEIAGEMMTSARAVKITLGEGPGRDPETGREFVAADFGIPEAEAPDLRPWLRRGEPVPLMAEDYALRAGVSLNAAKRTIRRAVAQGLIRCAWPRSGYDLTREGEQVAREQAQEATGGAQEAAKASSGGEGSQNCQRGHKAPLMASTAIR